MKKTKNNKIIINLGNIEWQEQDHLKLSKALQSALSKKIGKKKTKADKMGVAGAIQQTVTITFTFKGANRSNCSGYARCNGVDYIVDASDVISIPNVSSGNAILVGGYNPGADTDVDLSGVSASPQSYSYSSTHFGGYFSIN